MPGARSWSYVPGSPTSTGASVPELGLMIEGQEGLTWPRWLALVEAAEDLGFASLHRSDHLTGIEGDADRASLSLWPSLTVAAERTRRIRFGPMVSPMTFLPPALVAKMAMDLDVLSEGRLDVGIGAGWNEAEHAMFGIPYPRYPERLALLDEAAAVICALWRGGPTSLDGTHLSLRDAQVQPRATGPEPFLVLGGKGPRTLRVVAERASEWNCSYVGVDTFREKSEALDAQCRAIGRDPATLGRSVMVPFVVGRDDAEVARAIARHRATFSGLPSDLDAWVAAGFIGGSPQRVAEQLGAFTSAGASRFMLQHNDLDDRASLELLASEVLAQVGS